MMDIDLDKVVAYLQKYSDARDLNSARLRNVIELLERICGPLSITHELLPPPGQEDHAVVDNAQVEGAEADEEVVYDDSDEDDDEDDEPAKPRRKAAARKHRK